MKQDLSDSLSIIPRPLRLDRGTGEFVLQRATRLTFEGEEAGEICALRQASHFLWSLPQNGCFTGFTSDAEKVRRLMRLDSSARTI
jgi:hypothetical protein